MTNKQTAKMFWIVAISTTSNVAHANAAIPIVAVTILEMLILFLPICLIEAWIYSKYVTDSKKRIIFGSALANFVTTIIGLPLAWILYLIPSMAVIFGLSSLTGDSFNRGSLFTEIILGIFGAISLPSMPHLDGGKITYPFVAFIISQVVMLIPAYFVSVWLEFKVLKKFFKINDIESFKPVVVRANRMTYRIVLICIFLELMFLLSLRN